MSKRIEAQISCPHCSNRFDYTLFRSIWGEYPENRALVMEDKINVATCPSCNTSTKLLYAFIYTNADQDFAVWWEPQYDPHIDKDSKGYAAALGEGNYLAAAPRIEDWEEFKNTIIKFETGVLKGKPGNFSKDMGSQVKGALKHRGGKKKKPGA